jgi:hypothetical protein
VQKAAEFGGFVRKHDWAAAFAEEKQLLIAWMQGSWQFDANFKWSASCGSGSKARYAPTVRCNFYE